MGEQVRAAPRYVTAAAGIGRHEVHAGATLTGAGLVVILAGGEQPHVGAVGLGVPRPGLRDPELTSASSSVLTLTGHHDDELAKPLAEVIAAQTGQVAVVVVGVHVEGATAEDIGLLRANTRLAAERLLERLAQTT